MNMCLTVANAICKGISLINEWTCLQKHTESYTCIFQQVISL